MKIRHKTVLAIAAVCSCLSMFCIGFSNWSIGAEGPIVTGNISAEDVMESSYYIAYATTSDNVPFKFDTDGFIIDGSERSLSTTFSVTYNLYPGHISKLAPQKATVTVSLGLPKEEGSDNFLKKDYITTVQVTYDGTEQTGFEFGRNDATNTYDVSYSIDTSSFQPSDNSSVPITVTYTIEFSDIGKYKQYVVNAFGGENGNKLNGTTSTLGLIFSASVMDGGVKS